MRDNQPDILLRLRQTECEHNVRILFAVESGSRAWGFASPDSDWDVRFVYVHKPEWYFQIEERKDTIERMYPDDIDLGGWELGKALKLFKRSNPSFFEWLESPVVYCEDKPFMSKIRNLECRYFDADRAMFHYNHIYKKHNDRYIEDYGLPLKRFLYYLRGVLVCKWLERHRCVPPVLFENLVNATVDNGRIKKQIAQLLELKRQSMEHNMMPVNGQLFGWTLEQAEYYDCLVKKLRVEKKTNTDVALNRLYFDEVGFYLR